MIQINDLRIGNYVSDIHSSKSFMAKVKQLDFTMCYYGDFKANYSDLEPIPLTEEILLKCGFERKGYTSSKGLLSIHHKEPMYPKGRIYFNSWCIKNEMPNYLHQLQNLYFALTNEELQIEL